VTPVDLLIAEHRLISRMSRQLEIELRRIESNGEVDCAFIEEVADFFWTYTDRCHHGKEENILFAALVEKSLSRDHSATMSRLVEQHVEARKLVGDLLLAKDSCGQGNRDTVGRAAELTRRLVEFHPAHMALEENTFFPASLGYLSRSEQADMLRRFQEFDSRQIHIRYELRAEEWEKGRGR